MNKIEQVQASTDEKLHAAKLMLDAKLVNEQREHDERVRAIWSEYECESKRIVRDAQGAQDEL